VSSISSTTTPSVSSSGSFAFPVELRMSSTVVPLLFVSSSAIGSSERVSPEIVGRWLMATETSAAPSAGVGSMRP
jgi:hypothetical protein